MVATHEIENERSVDITETLMTGIYSFTRFMSLLIIVVSFTAIFMAIRTLAADMFPESEEKEWHKCKACKKRFRCRDVDAAKSQAPENKVQIPQRRQRQQVATFQRRTVNVGLNRFPLEVADPHQKRGKCCSFATDGEFYYCSFDCHLRLVRDQAKK
jgi:hypothetical protein